jgi:hypothetical protein
MDGTKHIIVPMIALKKLAKILEKRGWNTAGFLAFLRKIKKELIISEKWCWA